MLGGRLRRLLVYVTRNDVERHHADVLTRIGLHEGVGVGGLASDFGIPSVPPPRDAVHFIRYVCVKVWVVAVMSPSFAVAVNSAPTRYCGVPSVVSVAKVTVPLVQVRDLDGDLVVAQVRSSGAVGSGHHYLVGVLRRVVSAIRPVKAVPLGFSKSGATLTSGSSVSPPMSKVSSPSLLMSKWSASAKSAATKPVGGVVPAAATDQVMGVTPSGSVAVKVATAFLPFSAKFWKAARISPAPRPRCRR